MTTQTYQLQKIDMNGWRILLLIVYTFSYLLQCDALVYLAKTKETFKLAELQLLEAKLQAEVDNYSLTRLILDRSTGSTLFWLELPEGFPFSLERQQLPPSLRRCEWIAEVIEWGTNPENLVNTLRQYPSAKFGDLWTLDYIRLETVEDGGANQRRRSNYTMKSLVCSVAQALPNYPALNPAHSKAQLLIVDTKTSADESCYLTKLLSFSGENSQRSTIAKEWALRPFQYSSAININVAETVIDMVSEMVHPSKKEVTLLDPTCGSGTFLAFAIAKGIRVEACDRNDSCVEGSTKNLIHMFGEEKVQKASNVYVHDSSNIWKDTCSEIDCVVANLPWGVNSMERFEENERILRSVRARISVDTPCAFVTRDQAKDLFTDSGFEVLGQAHLPQRDFVLPKGKKKKDSKEIDRNRRNRCVVTIARSI